jgi:hypothetical protein
LRAGVTIPDLNESGIFPSAKIWLKIEDKIGAITSLECFRCSAVIPNSSALFFKLSFYS